MATAQFPATYVYEKAVERACEVEQRRLRQREVTVRAIMAEPVVSGRLWWKTITYRTEEQAGEYYDRNAARSQTGFWWDEMWARNAVKRLAPLQRIAAATIQSSGDGPVTLTPDDCEALDIPLNFQVVK